MQNGIILYILIFGILSSVIWTYMQKNLSGNLIVHFIKALLFFYTSHYFIISFVKLYLGSAENTLYESFWDIERLTYVHYGIPLVLSSILMPVLMKWTMKAKAIDFINVYGFCILISLFFEFLLKCRISNMWYCCTYILCLVLTFLINFIYKKGFNYINQNEYKKYIIEALPTIGAWAITVGIYLPNELFLSNPDDFMGAYWIFLCIMLSSSLLVGAIIIILGIIFVPKKIYEALNILLASIILLGYIQSLFLNGKLAAMDGIQQVWSNGTRFINILIWIVPILTIMLIRLRKSFIVKVCQWLCVYIMLIQIATLGYLILTSNLGTIEKREALTDKGSLQIAEDNNIIVFILDCYEGDWFEDLIDEDESFIEPLADFTYYRNSTAQFFHTAPSIPYILTGVEWSDDNRVNYANYAYQNSNVLDLIYSQGYDIGLYTNITYVSESVYSMTSNWGNEIQYKYKYFDIFASMVNASMYKISPFVLKNAHYYYSGDFKDIILGNNVWNIENDIYFYKNLTNTGLSVQEGLSNAFRFYHMKGAHAPFCLTEDFRYDSTGRESSLNSQARGSMKIVYEYLEQLKQLGKYDDATIIITADHGQGTIVDSHKMSGSPDRTSRPIFIIKLPYEENDFMQVNNAPVSQAELIPTYLKAVGLDWKAYGRTFDEVPEDEQRKRRVVDDYWNRFIIYNINGDASDVDDWSIISAEYFY